MASNTDQPKWRDSALSTLNVAIGALNLAKEISDVTPAKAVFGSVSVLLTMIRDSMANEQDFVELGTHCADVCMALDRGLNGRRDELSQPVRDAIEQLTTTVSAIQRKVSKQGKRNALSRFFHAKEDKDTIGTWRQDLSRILCIFNTELAINTHTLVADIHRNMLTGLEDVNQSQSNQISFSLGELPPPAPRTCFGRDELIEELVGLAETLEPMALIGAGGIGKTSIALTVLHHDRMKLRFGDHRRFIRCDRFPPSLPQFLAWLSKVIGAGVENPEDFATLRPFLSSHKIFIVLDNAESVLDPQGTDAREIYGVFDELCQFKTVCICITSRLTTVPRHCKRLEISTLSMEAARDVFYSIHVVGGQRSGIIDDLLRRLDFHALSITLLATAASHNVWDYDELAKEWDMHRRQVLRTHYNESLAATIDLSLASPTFRALGADTRDLLGVVAFFPQGIDEKNLDSFFPAVSERKKIFATFRILSLTHRSHGFITMLAPIRDYLCLQDPKSSPLLCAVRDCYFNRLSLGLRPGEPGFEEAQWIKSEDVNVEHLLDVFTGTPVDASADDVWDACDHFMEHLYYHKKRQTVLGPKISSLPNDHPSKPGCLLRYALLVESIGNFAEKRRLLSHALELAREQGNDFGVGLILSVLSATSRALNLHEEGMREAKEAIEIFERLDGTAAQADILIHLAFLLHFDKQSDAAERATFRAMELLPMKGQEYQVSRCHWLLGTIYRSKSDRENAIHHYETGIGIASNFNWHDLLFQIHYSLSEVFVDHNEIGNAVVHARNALSHVVEGNLGKALAPMLQLKILSLQGRLGEAGSETLEVLEALEEEGAVETVEFYREMIEAEMRERASGENHPQ